MVSSNLKNLRSRQCNTSYIPSSSNLLFRNKSSTSCQPLVFQKRENTCKLQTQTVHRVLMCTYDVITYSHHRKTLWALQNVKCFIVSQKLCTTSRCPSYDDLLVKILLFFSYTYSF